MKNVFFLLLALCFHSSNAQQVDMKHCLAYTDTHRILFGNATEFSPPDEDIQSSMEPYYINNGVYSINVKENKGIIYLSWLVCDDHSGGYFILMKDSGAGDTSIVKCLENLDCPSSGPLLYSVVDTSVINQSMFYTLYKINKEGERKKIVTLFIPILDDYELPPVTSLTSE